MHQWSGKAEYCCWSCLSVCVCLSVCTLTKQLLIRHLRNLVVICVVVCLELLDCGNIWPWEKFAYELKITGRILQGQFYVVTYRTLLYKSHKSGLFDLDLWCWEPSYWINVLLPKLMAWQHIGFSVLYEVYFPFLLLQNTWFIRPPDMVVTILLSSSIFLSVFLSELAERNYQTSHVLGS